LKQHSPAAKTIRLRGPAGAIQAIQEGPSERDPLGIALLCHPHPLHDGTMNNKVVHTLARAFVSLGCVAIRFNFRGVGDSEGSFADGIGEVADTVAVAEWARLQWPDLPFYLGGFSFGAMVAFKASEQLLPDGLVTVAPPVARIDAATSQPGCRWLVVQGDADEIVDADEVIEWLNSLEPGPELKMMGGAEHFFHGRLIELRDNIIEFFRPDFAIEQ